MEGTSNMNMIQATIEKQLEEENLEEVEILDFNPLQVYFGEKYVVNEYISISQPTIQDYIDYGEDNILDVLRPFITNTTGCRVWLWDMGVDWNKISNQELFYALITKMNPEYSKIIFGDVNFSEFLMRVESKDDGQDKSYILYHPTLGIELDEEAIHRMSRYIQHVFHISPPEEEFTSNKTLKQELINNDKQKIIAKKKELKNSSGSNLLSMISFCLNHPGFKYKKDELRSIHISEFMDSVQRLQIYESTRALHDGLYCGMRDLSKVNKNDFNFMRDIKLDA